MALANFDPTAYYWLWVPFGPSYTGIYEEKHFVEGMHPFPVDGPTAERYQLAGYRITPYDPAKEFSHWEGSRARWEPVFVEKAKRGRPKKSGSKEDNDRVGSVTRNLRSERASA